MKTYHNLSQPIGLAVAFLITLYSCKEDSSIDTDVNLFSTSSISINEAKTWFEVKYKSQNNAKIKENYWSKIDIDFNNAKNVNTKQGDIVSIRLKSDPFAWVITNQNSAQPLV